MALISNPKKESRKTNFMKKILNGDKPTQASSFMKRNPTLKKKAFELQTLCDISVVIVSYGDDGRVEIFSDDETDVRSEIMSYKKLEPNKKRECNLFNFLETKKAKLVKKKKQVTKAKIDKDIKTLAKHVDELSGESLMDFVAFLEDKLMSFQEKLKFLELAPVATQVDSVSPYVDYSISFCSFEASTIFNDVVGQRQWSDPKDELCKFLMINKAAECPNVENCFNGDNTFMVNGGTFAQADVNYDNNATMINKFSNYNFEISSTIKFAQAEVNYDNNATLFDKLRNYNFEVGSTNNSSFGNNDIFWWDDEMVQY